MSHPVSARSHVYRITLDAMFVALYVILGTFLSFKIPGAIQISFSTLPILLCAFLCKPTDAVAVALIGTFLEQVIDPSPYGFATLPLWLIPNAVLALIAAAGAWRITRLENRRLAVVLTCITIVIAELILTACNTGMLYLDGYLLQYPVKALHLLLPTRIVNGLVRSAISACMVSLLAPPLRRILAKFS